SAKENTRSPPAAIAASARARSCLKCCSPIKWNLLLMNWGIGLLVRILFAIRVKLLFRTLLAIKNLHEINLGRRRLLHFNRNWPNSLWFGSAFGKQVGHGNTRCFCGVRIERIAQNQLNLSLIACQTEKFGL